MGRLTKDVNLREGQKTNMASYTLAVKRIYKKDECDFINIIAFGKAADFAHKYFRKGQLVAIEGRLQIENKEIEGIKKYYTNVIVDQQYFAESKKERVLTNKEKKQEYEEDDDKKQGFLPVDQVEVYDFPF